MYRVFRDLDVFFSITVQEKPLRDVLITHCDRICTDAFHATPTPLFQGYQWSSSGRDNLCRAIEGR